MNFIDKLIDFQYWGYIIIVLIVVLFFLYVLFYRKNPEAAKLPNQKPTLYWNDRTYKYIFITVHIVLLTLFITGVFSRDVLSIIKIPFLVFIIFFSLPEFFTYFKYRNGSDFRLKINYRNRTGNITIPHFKKEYLTKELLLIRNSFFPILFMSSIFILIYLNLKQ